MAVTKITMKSIESKIIQENDDSFMSNENMERVKECAEWAEKSQEIIGASPFGSNRANVNEAMEKMKYRCRDVTREESQYRDFLSNQDLNIPEIREATREFDSLDALMAKQTACLEVISQISTLEDTVQSTALAIDTKSVHLVNSEGGNHVSEVPSYGNNGRLMTSAQNCNLAIRNNWRWIGQMLQCAQVHFHNAADFHQFFHDAQEAEYWMKNTLSTVHLSFDRSKLQGDMADVQSIKQEIKEVLLAYIQWQGKIDSLFERARNIVPVSQRLKPIEDSRPVTALADYKTSDIDFIEGESLTLLNNSDKKIWKVSNSRGQTALVPAVLLLIPSPYPDTVDIAIKMRVQLLALWTASVKRLGYQLIAFMLLVVKDYSENDIKEFGKLSSSQQQELINLLKYIEETLMVNWTGYKDFEELQERMARIRFTLDENTTTARTTSGGNQQSVVIQFNALKDLLGKYGDFWAYWETYKVIVELLRQPKFVLVCDKWEQLRFVTTAHFVKFWDTNLDIDTGKVDQIEQTVVNKSLALHETPRDDMISTDYTVSTEKEETETEQVVTSMEEEERTFYMKDVVDPLTQKLVSFQDAIVRGIIDQTNARYVNTYTRESMPLREAINSGLIKLEWTTRNKIREEKRSFGLITIRTTRDSRPYNINQVIDPSTNRPIPTSEAVKRGILDTKNSVYVKGPDDHIPIPEAIDMGKIIIEYTGNKHSNPEVVTKTYAVHSIVDQKKKEKIPFAEAINQGLFDKQNGVYINNITGAKIPVGEAIMHGFIKARLVTDPSKLDINPENTVVIERIQNVRDKLVKGMKAVNALKAGIK